MKRVDRAVTFGYRWPTLILLVPAIALVLLVISSKRDSGTQLVKLPGGGFARLERFEFQTNRVWYELPMQGWPRVVERALPTWLKKRIGRMDWHLTYTADPKFPGERSLSVGFTQSGVGAGSVLRVVTADEQRNEFDPACQEATAAATVFGEICWIASVPTFPRRGEHVFLRLMTQTNLLAEFKIPNPAPGPYPQWTPNPLPVVATDAEFSVELVDFETFQTGQATFTKAGVYPRTRCAFRIRENGKESNEWKAVAFEIWDAAGNHWRPPMDPGKKRNRSSDDTLSVSYFLGALWPGEKAWRFKVQFQNVDEPRGSASPWLEFLACPTQIQEGTAGSTER